MTIHPSAIVSPRAKIGSDVEIGPFTIVEHDTVIGGGCRLAGRVTIKQDTILGNETQVSEGAVVGGLPQHAKATGPAGRVVIGDRCILRENVTVHRPLQPASETRVGSDCFLMVGAHVAHDCFVGDHVLLTNNVLLGGHVEVGARAVLGGAVAVHQFCRIGRLAMIGGCARVVQDVPPFVLTDGNSGLIVGLNRIGLRRAGLDRGAIKELKEAYRMIYRMGLPFDEMTSVLAEHFRDGPAAEFAPFFRGGQRGFVQERRSPPHAVIRIHPAAEEDTIVGRRLAG